jgi:N6-adenosine-specific RNA methylase IME4
MIDGMLFLNLPSGRRLAYPEPRVVRNQRDDNEVACKRFSNEKGWHEARLWGGLLLENIVQAIARDVLFEGMLRLQDAGFKLIMHVHDEVVCEGDDDNIDTDRFLKLLTARPTWMPDLPLAAKLWIGRRFDKAPPNNSATIQEIAAAQPQIISIPRKRAPKQYRIILADPPWDWIARSKKGTGRGAVSHYNTMSLEKILAMGPEVGAIAADDSALFLWVLNSMLPEALQVIEAWGFKFKTMGFTWAKRTRTDAGWHFGMGYWTRQSTEHCLFATRGHPKRFDKVSRDPKVRNAAAKVRELVIAPVRQHSQNTHERIEQLMPGPYVEFFSRKNRPGWDVKFSDQAGLLDRGTVKTRRQASSLVGVDEPGIKAIPSISPPTEPIESSDDIGDQLELPIDPQPVPVPEPPQPSSPPAQPILQEPDPVDEGNHLAVIKGQIDLIDFIGEKRVHCPFHDPEGKRSATVQVKERGFKCHAADCGEYGDVFDWIQEIESVDLEEAVEIAARWSGENRYPSREERRKREARGQARAMQLFREARPLAGTLATKYLQDERGIDLAQLPADIHEVLRFHPYCPFGRNDNGSTRHVPALLALFRDVLTDQPGSLHRIGLTREGKKLGRQMLGQWPGERAVKMWRIGRILAICEGVETGLAAGSSASSRYGRSVQQVRSSDSRSSPGSNACTSSWKTTPSAAPQR